MKDLLWSKPIPKTIVLAISPVLIGLLGNIVVSSPTILWIVLTGILFLLYILYLIGNANYESKQKHHETWHDAITSLCREDCTQIRTYADSIHQKVNSKVGHAEITDWEKVQSYCNSLQDSLQLHSGNCPLWKSVLCQCILQEIQQWNS